MAMNRETKRMLQRQGQVGPDGSPARAKPRPQPCTQPQPGGRGARERTGLRTFLKEVRIELRKVAWPTRPEVVNYSIIVLVAVVILTTYIALLDYGFAKAVLHLFNK